ncbi:MAG TPA: TSUP family transporter [Leptolyngbyaceae cyanobacterium]
MNILEFTLLVGLGSATAGFLGALTGLGGGVVLVPLLTLVFHVDIRYAIGASLVSVIATSSGAASAYVKEGYTNLRLGMFLEVATTFGAIAGAIIAAYTPS